MVFNVFNCAAAQLVPYEEIKIVRLFKTKIQKFQKHTPLFPELSQFQA